LELGKSLEDYLETILILTNKNGSVRSVDIARQMNFSKASISRAVKELCKKGYLTVKHNGFLYLTEKGTKYYRTKKSCNRSNLQRCNMAI
jgi:Mn-dependent DtxR family transcriptional regulator